MRPSDLCLALGLALISALISMAPACGTSTSEGPNTQPAPPAQPEGPEPAAGEGEDVGDPSPASPEADAPAPEPPGPPTRDSGVDELPELEGKSEAELRARFGEPTRTREFSMRECCTEFTVELRNTYPPRSGHDEVRIREWTWAYEGYALTVWLHGKGEGWEVLDTCRYSDDVEF